MDSVSSMNVLKYDSNALLNLGPQNAFSTALGFGTLTEKGTPGAIESLNNKL